MYKISKKLIASSLVAILMAANLSVVGVHAKEVYASDLNLNNQTVKTNHENVEFDTYYIKDEQKTHSDKKVIGEANKIYAEIKVKEAGYLKDATLTLFSKQNEQANLKISEGLKSEFVSKSNNNSITLNQIKSGTTAKIEIPFEFKMSENINISEFNRENIVKLIGTYVDGNGKQNKIEKEIKLGLEWTANGEVVLEEQISKFIPYDINGQKGLILQTIIKSNVKDNVMPVKQTNIEISVPVINNIKPEQVKVTANTTQATNGDINGLNFNQDNYTYNAETNKLNIKVENKLNEENIVSWKKQTQDEYVITYKYSSEALNTIGEQGVELTFNSTSKLDTYNVTDKKLEAKFEGKIVLKDQINNIVDFSVETIDTQLSKGYIYANYDTQEKVETEYKERITANIGLVDLTDKVIIEQAEDNFTKDEGKTKGSTTVSGTNYAYYKNLIVSRQVVNKILGEEGTIKINSGSTLIAEINKDTKPDEQGNIIIDLSKLNINSINIETSKPIAEGKLVFDITKAIKGNLAYGKTQMREFDKLQVAIIGKALNGETSFVEQNIQKDIVLVEPTSKAELVINKTNLSTVVTNQNVEIKTILKTDSIYNKLFKNPTIVLEFPSYVEAINVKDIKVLFENSQDQELKIKSAQSSVKPDGTKVIAISLEGTQTKYAINSISGGTNIVVIADITVNKLTPSKDDIVKMYYTNSNVIEKARTSIETNETQIPVSFVAPTGVVTTTSINGYKDNSEKLTSVSGEEQIAVIETLSKERNVTFDMSVINNYDNTVDNISILGRVPFKGNKDITSGQPMGSTIDMKLQSQITVNGVDASKIKIYYTENGEATKDLNNASNGWTTTPANMETVKSYLITINDYAMNKGDSISFSYSAQIPENLQHNESAFSKYTVYFNNNLETGKIEDKAVAARTGITTGAGPVLEANITSNTNETVEVREGKIIKYTVSVKNTGTENANDVKATINIPASFSYVLEDKTSSLGYKYGTSTDGKAVIDLGIVEPNKTISKEVWFKVNKVNVEDFCKDDSHYLDYGDGTKYHDNTKKHADSEYKATINIQASITTSSLSNELKTNIVKNNITKAYFTTTPLKAASNEYILKENSKFIYYLNVKSSDTNVNRDNSTITMKLPDEMTYESLKMTKYNKDTKKDEDITSEAKVNFNSKTKELTIEIGTVDSGYGKVLEITMKTGSLAEGKYEQKVDIQASIQGNNTVKEDIETVSDSINKAGLKISQTATIPNGNRITTREDFKYILDIENLSNIIMNDIKITDIMPKEIIYKGAKVTYKDGTTKTYSKTDENGNPEIEISLKEKQTAKVEIDVVADAIENDTKVTNKIKISQQDIGTIETNSISHTIEKYDGKVPDEDVTTKRISGQVWKDENNDGIKDENESKLSNVEVMLFNNSTGKLVTDNLGNVLKVKTDNNGNYTFTNIAKGSYTVIFMYDTANYSSTTYKKNDVDETKNSDAVDSKITLGGKTQIAAITEEIVINNSNIYNIDLGLISNPKFDLKLDKTVSKVTVQNNAGTKAYEYKDSKLAKVEIVGKQVNNTSIVVEYKIKVTNEGAIPGYVKKIVDYLPSELKFSSELNRDWYTSGNGTIYNSSLANTIINPGESKEVTLTLTKKMSENNLGLINNTAEIYEAYNDLGIEDVDSTPGNKVSNEDDMSFADVLTTVKTGETIMFILLTTGIIAIIATGAYFIKKKVLR